jgi:hypothetical protein
MIVIPMAGLSNRFAIAGYTRPKYLLPLGTATVFRHAVSSFSAYFTRESFLFIVRDIHGTQAFVEKEAAALGIEQAHVVALSATTRGQAMTVMLGLERIGCLHSESLTIFNIDTFRPDFRYPELYDINEIDGFLEVFRGSGANWSYVRPHPSRPWRVVKTAEKRQISRFCCTGLYYFRTSQLFGDAYSVYLQRDQTGAHGGELYVAPLYNVLIQEGRDIRYVEIKRSDVVFCGTPSEYEALI